jgi:anti-sigma factor RsiW
MSHVNDEELLAYLDDAFDATARTAIEHHLGSCATCRAELARWQALFAEVAALPDETPDVDLTPLVLAALAPRWSWRAWLALTVQIVVALALAIWLLPGLSATLGAVDLTPLWQETSRWIDEQQTALSQALRTVESALAALRAPQILQFQPVEWASVLVVAACVWLIGNRLLLKEVRR